MPRIPPVLLLITLIAISSACKKNTAPSCCFSNTNTIRQITNKQAIVKVTATLYPVYLVEEGAIDSKLLPCNLPSEFVQNNLQVTISGMVKSTAQVYSPCCAEDFVITKISR